MTDETTRPEDTEPEGDDTDQLTIDDLPALDDDDEPDELVGDLTDPDIDLSFLEVEEDEDGGDNDE